jgi:hypothetical protein
MSILATTDFVGLYHIDFSNDSVKEDFEDNFLPEREAELLKNLLGYTLATEFLDGMAEDDPEQKWLDLRDGAPFTVKSNESNIILKFAGVKELLKKVIWAEFQLDNQVEYSATGAKLNDSDNTTFSENATKINDIYNKAIRENYGSNIIGYKDGTEGGEKLESYLDVECLDFWTKKKQYERAILQGSAYNFIYQTNFETPDTYENWQFTPIKLWLTI